MVSLGVKIYVQCWHLVAIYFTLLSNIHLKHVNGQFLTISDVKGASVFIYFSNQSPSQIMKVPYNAKTMSKFC